MALSLILMAYREAENLTTLIPQIIENIQKATDDYEILVVDSPNSDDNTKEICEQFGVQHILQEIPYYAGAFQAGVKHASKDIFLMMDADFSHPPEVIPVLYKTFTEGNFDVGIGSRYVKDGINDDEKQNILFSKILNFAYRTMFGLDKIGDISAGFKMYRTEQIKDIPPLMSKFFEMHIEVLVKLKLKKQDLKVVEVPIHFKERFKGKSKRNYFTFLPQFAIIFIRLFFYKLFYRKKK